MNAEPSDDRPWSSALSIGATLPAIAVDEVRAERVRARCHEVLERRKRRPLLLSAFVAAAMRHVVKAWSAPLRLVGREWHMGANPGARRAAVRTRPGPPISDSARS